MDQAFPTSKRRCFSYEEENAMVLLIKGNVVILFNKEKITNNRANVSNPRTCGYEHNHSAHGSRVMCAQLVRMTGKDVHISKSPKNHVPAVKGKVRKI